MLKVLLIGLLVMTLGGLAWAQFEGGPFGDQYFHVGNFGNCRFGNCTSSGGGGGSTPNGQLTFLGNNLTFLGNNLTFNP